MFTLFKNIFNESTILNIPYQEKYSYLACVESEKVMSLELAINDNIMTTHSFIENIATDFIKKMQKEFNKNDITNEKISFEEMKKYIFGDILLKNIDSELPYVLLLKGCTYCTFIHFKTKENREKFINFIEMNKNKASEIIFENSEFKQDMLIYSIKM